MKKHLLLMLAAITLLFVASCSTTTPENPDNPIPNPPISEMVTVGFMLSGDITLSESPLTKSASNDLYGVNITTKDPRGQFDQNYALGIFDDISKLSVNLPKNTKFAIHLFLIKNAKKIFPANSRGVPTVYPFNVTNITTSLLEPSPKLTLNEVAYSQISYLFAYQYEFDDVQWLYPQIDMYSGYKTEIEAIEQNEIITIPLCRASFGLDITVVNLVKGDSVAVYLGVGNKDKPVYVKDKFKGVFSFAPYYAKKITYNEIAEQFDFYSEKQNMQIDLVKSTGEIVTILRKQMEYKRNVMTSFTLDIDVLTSSTGTIDPTLEVKPMENEDLKI